MVGLKTYQIKDKEVYETLRNMLSGYAFFRKDDDKFYMKCPINNVVNQFLELNLIINVN